MIATFERPQLDSPFPGLRPFELHEDAIFFGRHEQVNEMLQRLETERLLTVVGASGCGKSSLVRAGLLPALQEGFLFGAGSDWRFVILKPGDNPYRALATALCEALPEVRPDDPEMGSSFVQAILLSGDKGLVRIINDAGLPPGSNVLVLVDQFEELFRFRSVARRESQDTAEVLRAKYEERNRANAFVNLILETVGRRYCKRSVAELSGGDQATSEMRCGPAIFFILTIRSEFLGHCDAFLNLPQAISKSQFLTPRMTREQIRDAVVRPLDLFGATAQPALVNRILNDVGSDPDSLPLMQHALLRTWERAKERWKQQPVEGAQRIELGSMDYEEVGGFTGAIRVHADEAYTELGSDSQGGKHYQRVAEQLFRLLSYQTNEGVVVRNPIRIAEAAAAAAVSADEIAYVAKVFGQKGRNFITFSTYGQRLRPDTTLDISHEALIRNWDRLKVWLKAEAESAENYLWLEKAARRWEEKKGGLFHGADLRTALSWEKREKPSQRWAARYSEDYALAMGFLRKSERRRRYMTVLLTIAVCGLVGWIGTLLTHEYLIKAEIAKSARSQSNEFLGNARDFLKQTGNPQAKAFALAALSRAVQRDRHNTKAIELACDLLLRNSWCPPLTPPLRYLSGSSILCATLVPEGSENRILAVSQDGWILEWKHGNTSLTRAKKLASGDKPIAFVSASFSKDGRELLTVPPPSDAGSAETQPGAVKAQFWKLEAGSYQPDGTVDIIDVGPLNAVYWSSDGKLLVFVPTRWDRSPVCQAFVLKGGSYGNVPRPFENSEITLAAISPTDELIATGSPKGEVQLWKWNEERFEKLGNSAIFTNSFDLKTRPVFLAFGPGKDKLMVTIFDQSGHISAKILDLHTGPPQIVEPPIRKDQFMRFVLGPIDGTNRLVATALYSRVALNDAKHFDLRQPITEPIGFQGTAGLPVFSRDGRELLTLSGAVWLAMDTVQIWNLRFRPALGENDKFQSNGEPAPGWFVDLARAVSGVPRSSYDPDESSPTLESVKAQARPETIRGPYATVWRHFFPDELSVSGK
jgi:energy-coupling factor transporter ATP-binding protein EcfA2